MSKRILVASSDVEFRSFLSKMFRCGGARVRCVDGEVRCIELMLEDWPDTLVLDKELRGGSADGVLDWLRERNSLDYVEVVLLVDDVDADVSYQTCEEAMKSLLGC